MGVDRILAVNTIPTPAYLGCCREMEREQAELRPRRAWFLRALNKHLNYFARGNILDNLLHAFYGAQMSVAEAACRQAHLVLRPLACDASWHDFTHPGKYIALGRRVAEEHLDEIKSFARAPEYSDESTPSQLAMAAAA
jgi:hypothetical protein